MTTAEEDFSLLDQIALLPEAERNELLEEMQGVDLKDPGIRLRPSQLAILQDLAWIILNSAGRGSGKSESGSSWVNDKAKQNPGCLISLVGRTVADVRDVMVQGTSGLLATATEDFMPVYTPSLRKVVWPNGSSALTHSADQPNTLRGPQSHYTWSDELASFRLVPDDSGATIWDHIIISTRLGAHPQILITTTPKRTTVIKGLFRDAANPKKSVSLHNSSILANRANLAPEYLAHMLDKFVGTALEHQELHGALIGDIAGAMLGSADIRRDENPPARKDMHVIIAVDPSVEAGQDETGIMVVGSSKESNLADRKGWVLDDLTTDKGPDQWSQTIVEAWEKWNLPDQPVIVVAEGNQGGQMIPLILHQDNPAIMVAVVKAVVNKAARAEPVALAYKRRRAFHVAEFPELEDEWTSWEPLVSRWSPGRIDACVWGFRCLLVDDAPLRPYQPIEMLGSREASRELVVHPAFRRPQEGTFGMGVAPWRGAVSAPDEILTR